MKTSRFLIVHTFGLGDMIMFTPALELLFKQFPAAQFDFFISYPPVADIVRAFPQTECIFFKKGGFHIAKQIYELRKRYYDYVVVTSGHSPWKSGLFTKMLNAGYTLGEYENRVCLFDKGARREKHSHRIANNLKITAPLTGVDYKAPIPPRISAGPWSVKHSDTMANEMDDTGNTLIGIHCGSRTTQAYKRWPVEFFCQLLAEIHQVYGNTTFVIFAGASEAEEARFINRQLPHCSRIIIDEALQVVTALLRRCRLMIANDSGLGHLAAALGTPTLSIFGPSDPGKCAPIGEHCRYVKLDDFCSPCIADSVPPKCRETAACMLALKPDAVFPYVAEMLEGSSGAGKMVR